MNKTKLIRDVAIIAVAGSLAIFYARRKNVFN